MEAFNQGMLQFQKFGPLSFWQMHGSPQADMALEKEISVLHPGDQSVAASTHVRWLTTTDNSSSRGPRTLFFSSMGSHVHICIHIHGDTHINK